MQLLMFATPMEMKAVAIRIDSKSTETCHYLMTMLTSNSPLRAFMMLVTVPVVQHFMLTSVCLCC